MTHDQVQLHWTGDPHDPNEHFCWVSAILSPHCWVFATLSLHCWVSATFSPHFPFCHTTISFLTYCFSSHIAVALGRNQPLKRERPKWKSDYPMTEGQLRSKRDEFWDTAPAFEGRKEIWDALRAAASAFESGDHMLAQAILDGASITLPHGNSLTPLSPCPMVTQSPLTMTNGNSLPSHPAPW